MYNSQLDWLEKKLFHVDLFFISWSCIFKRVFYDFWLIQIVENKNEIASKNIVYSLE